MTDSVCIIHVYWYNGSRDLAKAGKGGGVSSYFRNTPSYFKAPHLFNIVSLSFLMLFFAVFFWTKLVFECFGIICKSLKKPHNLVYFNTSSLKYECPPPFERLLAKTLTCHGYVHIHTCIHQYNVHVYVQDFVTLQPKLESCIQSTQFKTRQLWVDFPYSVTLQARSLVAKHITFF